MANIRRAPKPVEAQKGFKSVKFEEATRDKNEVERRYARDKDSLTDNHSKKNVN